MQVLAAGAVGVLLSVGLVARAQTPDAGSSERPNVLLIVADDLDERFAFDVRRPDTGAFAFPALRSIAERGARFSNSFVSLPLCSPSRASILTGLYAHNHGVVGNADENGGYALFRDAETLPVWLSRAGYRTALVGKYLNGYSAELVVDGQLPVPAGWSAWFASLSPASYLGWSAARGAKLTMFGRGPEDYHTDVVAREALAQLGGSEPRPPFFVMVNFFAPHDDAPGVATPALPASRHTGVFANYEPDFPPSFDEADIADKPEALRKLPRLGDATRATLVRRLRARLEALLAVDEAVGALLARLAERGELERTLVIFTSDNGFEQGEHRIRTGKGRAYEESIRVPLVACGPGIPRGVVVDELVLNLDLAPTILEACGAQPALEPDGRSWLALFRESRAPWRQDFLVEGTRDQRYLALRSRRALYVEHEPTAEGRAPERELYLLAGDERAAADPFQLENRASDPRFAADLAALGERLDRLRGCRGAACW